MHVEDVFVSPLTFAGGFVGTSAVVDVVTDPVGSWESLQPLVQKLLAGRYWEATALALVVFCALVRKYGPSISPRMNWVKGDVGGALLVFFGSLGGAAATALAAGTAPSLALLVLATKVAFAASGGYSLVKRIAVPSLEWLAMRSPQWLHWAFDLALWVFNRNTAIAIAEKAGKDAVQANPAGGVAAVIGTPKEVQ